jgi:hypothetical protein
MPSALEWLGFWRRSAGEIELDIRDELDFHMEECCAELVGEGLSEREAKSEAERRFGNVEAVRKACRKVQLGGRIMQQRITSVLVVVLLLALVLMGLFSMALHRQSRARLEMARAQASALNARMASLGALWGDAAEQSDPLTAAEVMEWRARYLEAPNDAAHGLALAEEIADLSAERAVELLNALWPSLPAAHRQQAFKPFVFRGLGETTAHLARLAIEDPDPVVRGRGLLYLKYPLHVTSDLELVRRWFEQAPTRIGIVDDFRARLSAVEDAEGAAVDLDSILADEGMIELMRSCLASTDPFHQRELAQAWIRELGPDEATERAIVLPLLENLELAPEVHAAACKTLGRPGNDWAVQPLLDALLAALERPAQSRARQLVRPAAWALAEIGNPRAIPPLIGILAADETGETTRPIGLQALPELTGAGRDGSGGADEWRLWWREHRDELPADVRALAIPDYRF